MEVLECCNGEFANLEILSLLAQHCVFVRQHDAAGKHFPRAFIFSPLNQTRFELSWDYAYRDCKVRMTSISV